MLEEVVVVEGWIATTQMNRWLQRVW